MRRRKAILIALGAVLALAATPASALYIETSYVGQDQGDGLWSHTDDSRITGRELSSSVQFTLNGTELSVLLSNNSTVATGDLADVLQGVFFNAPGLTLTGGSAALGNDSNLVPEDVGDVANLQGWAYRDDLDTGDPNPFGMVYDVTHGIGNPGLDTFGKSDAFDPDFWPNHPPYGIVSPDTTLSNGISQAPMVNHSLLFTFDVDGTFDLANIRDDVVFHYGTTANVIPEPATMTLLGLGLAGFGARRFVSRKKKA